MIRQVLTKDEEYALFERIMLQGSKPREISRQDGLEVYHINQRIRLVRGKLRRSKQLAAFLRQEVAA